MIIIAEDQNLVKAYEIQEAIQFVKNKLITFFNTNVVYKYPSSEAEDNYRLVANENMTLQELCLLTTQIFATRNNTTVEPLPPFIINQDSILANAFDIRNKVQYCNNLLRYCLKRRNINIGDVNELSLLIDNLYNIPLLDSSIRIFTLPKQQYFSNEQIIIQQQNVLNANRNSPIQYYNDEYQDTNYDVNNIIPLSLPKTINFANGLSINSDTFFDMSIGAHKKAIKDVFNKKYYLSYEVIPPRDIVKKVEVDNNGDLIIYFIPKDDLDNTIIATDFDIDNNGDIIETDINVISIRYLEDEAIENIWIDENNDVCFFRHIITADSVLLEANKSILSYRDLDISVLTATVLDELGTPLPNQIVTFRGNNNILGYSITDSNGQAKFRKNSSGMGDVSLVASTDGINSNACLIEDCFLYDIPLTDKTSLITVSNPYNVPYTFIYSDNIYRFTITENGQNDKNVQFIFDSEITESEIIFELDFRIKTPLYYTKGYNAVFYIRNPSNEPVTGLAFGTWSVQRMGRIYSNGNILSTQTSPSGSALDNDEWYHLKGVLTPTYAYGEIVQISNQRVIHSFDFEDIDLSYSSLECCVYIFSGMAVASEFKNIKIKKV